MVWCGFGNQRFENAEFFIRDWERKKVVVTIAFVRRVREVNL